LSEEYRASIATFIAPSPQVDSIVASPPRARTPRVQLAEQEYERPREAVRRDDRVTRIVVLCIEVADRASLETGS
jgi:hypothetical protein